MAINQLIRSTEFATAEESRDQLECVGVPDVDRRRGEHSSGYRVREIETTLTRDNARGTPRPSGYPID